MSKIASKSSKSKISWKQILIIFEFLIWVFASIIVAQLVIGYLLLWLLGAEKFQLPVWTAVYSALSYILALALIIFVPWKLFKKWQTNRKELGLIGLPTWTDIGLAIVGFIVATIIGFVLVAFFNLFPWFNAAEAQDVGFSSGLYGADRIVAFITLVIVAPIAEEIIFRGWLYGKLRQKLSLPLAIFLVSLLFALIHGQWNVGVNVFALSVVLCGLREVTGTIHAGILTHMIKNGVAFYLLYMI